MCRRVCMCMHLCKCAGTCVHLCKCTGMCVHACACVNVQACVCMCVHVVGGGREHWLSLSIILCLLPLRQGLSVNLEVGWTPASSSKLQQSSGLYPTRALGLYVQVGPFPAFLCGCCGFEPTSLWLASQHSYQLSQLPDSTIL